MMTTNAKRQGSPSHNQCDSLHKDREKALYTSMNVGKSENMQILSDVSFPLSVVWSRSYFYNMTFLHE